MNRIDLLFEKKDNGILSIFMTAGYPNLDDTVSIIEALDEAGVDMIEIGIPFSDPIADGPVIQHSSMAALANGMSIDLLMDQLKEIRTKTTLPLILMGYINPVMQILQDGGKCRYRWIHNSRSSAHRLRKRMEANYCKTWTSHDLFNYT